MTFSLFRPLRKAILRAAPRTKSDDKKVFATVMQGFRMTLEDDRFEVLVSRLNEVEADWRGFAYEGVGLGFAIFDALMPWRKRLQAFVRGPGAPYSIPLYIGVGLALGRLNSRRPERFMVRLENPTFHWMVVDGYGFYKGTFALHRYLEEQAVPAHLSSYARRVFDQGLGRSIWFVSDEQVDQASRMIAAFPATRQADLWSGTAFACAYAGSSLKREALEALRTAAGPHRSQLALAGSLAAKRRYGLGHITPHTELACQVFCDVSGEMAAHIADNALENLPTDGVEPSHKIWRERILAYFSSLAANERQSGINAVESKHPI